MVVVPPGEDGAPAGEDLGEYAPDGPDVDRFGVLTEGEHYFGGSVGGEREEEMNEREVTRKGLQDVPVPPCRDVFLPIDRFRHHITLCKVTNNKLTVMNPFSPPGSAVFIDLASPKSHNFRSQFEFSNKFDGFTSRCMTSAECTALRARRSW